MDPRALLLICCATLAFLQGRHVTVWLDGCAVASVPALAFIVFAVAVATVGCAALLALRCVSLHRQGCLVWGGAL